MAISRTDGNTLGSKPRAVLDTDTYNEIDDQFALAYLLRASDVAEPAAIYAAPFSKRGAASPADGMEKSFAEIERLLARLGQEGFPHFRGSDRLLGPDREPVRSDAVTDLVARGMSASATEPLTIVAIAALTNVASALLAEPRLAERCRVVWLGGNYPYWPHNQEFNLTGDLEAARVVFDSGVPLSVMPTLGVSSHLTTSREELAAHLDRDDPLCAFLFGRFADHSPAEGVWTKEIWDIAAVAWVVLPEAVSSFRVPTPRIAEDGSYIHDPWRRLCTFAYRLERDAVYADLFRRLSPR